jgi:UDP-N-acetylglucosamine--N-acetylmuramyl-(pentapeptide) pyrophosphoryl-undecaprenol N-acetylglucosamine transferase
MNQQSQNKNIIISGGGTGGHVFPAISIAHALRQADPDINILFVGALGKIEMEKVPAAGYEIIGLPVQGFRRKLSIKNFSVLINLWKSLRKARQIVRNFKPGLAIGVGGYASGPVLRVAAQRGIPTLLQEQNSYAGITNKLLAKSAKKICVAYDKMERYFPAEKIIFTGNPVRQNIIKSKVSKEQGCKTFGLSAEKPVLLVVGGSQGARTINNSLKKDLKKLIDHDIQMIWQCGKFYLKDLKNELKDQLPGHIKLFDFINEMDHAFAAADIIISRAGAGTISELCLIGKPVILVPSPNVAEDHQRKNAESLEKKNAAVMILDRNAEEKLVPAAIELIENEVKRNDLSKNILKMALPDSAKRIAEEALKLIKRV